MYSQIVIVSISAALSLLLAFVVFVRNFRARINQTFFALSLLVVSWMMSSMMTDNAGSFEQKLLFGKLSFGIGILIPFAVLIMARYFPAIIKLRTIDGILGVLTLIIGVISFSNLIVSDIEITKTGVTNILTGKFYTLFLAVFLGSLSRALFIFYNQYNTANRSGKRQVKIMLYGLGIGLIWGIMMNAILPLFWPAAQSTRFGFLSTIILVGITGYAILKHKLFDIRFVVIRALGYVLSLIVLATTYGVVAFIVIDKFVFGVNSSSTLKRAVFTMLAVVLATTYNPLRQFFNRLTNKIFYRDAYDSQSLLDSFNRALLTTIDLDKLLKTTANTINEYIKSEYLLFGIKDFKGSPQRVVGTLDIDFAQEDIEKVRKITPQMRTKSIIVDDLPEDQANLKALLTANGISVLVRLTDTPDKKKEGMGYIVLGAKKSGGRYTQQDVRNLEIMADILVIAVQNSLRFEEIQSFNKTLQGKVYDATKKLRSANNRLVELDKSKDDFISMASHQLRTPLTSIKGYLSMVIDGDAGKVTAKQSELLSRAYVSSQRMVYLIADLLNVSRLRTGKFIIEPKLSNLATVINGELDQLKQTAKDRDLKLTFNNPSNFPDLMIDETKVRQVIMNFIDNAIYYTPSGGHVEVILEDKDKSIELRVVDDGIGVPKTEKHNLFNKFFRANNAQKARPDGTGLGLFMAKKVIIAQGGSIIFDTEEGKGSTFGFVFIKKPLLPENHKGVIK